MNGKMYTLLDANRQPYQSATPGTVGGNGKAKIYGRLDCHAALRAIKQGGYVETRVFFADEETAIAAGYRPCGACMRKEYAQWKAEQGR
ncbi:Ada metal-binding domain-containing protein [Bacillus sp. EB01]|uniref:Ada metal-binding domain-containing protein n=1 Tax=Bacillus sp. EB01 TaxID=1347086 RepID=UPI0005C76678|nr:Ada metal-binding domain-containing protein [Bacillus sp. EB01]